jgi:hypothetical protein
VIIIIATIPPIEYALHYIHEYNFDLFCPLEEWILGRLAWGVWIGFDWLRAGTGGGL